ncbi:polysaccharide deacetylase family protein [Mesonia sp.]|uniref:polysaccharide deacetylase family protein n=1 Tax=Mesonia sp. TaxID=1960830 RepID=UPI003F9E4802
MAELIPLLGKLLYPHRIWHGSRKEKVLYLTFDDGPIPEVTPWVLQLLDQFQAKATFFCIGENIQKHPAVLQAILKEEHRVGNHTLQHVNGWKTPSEEYLRQIHDTQQLINKYVSTSAKALFRPPYGKSTSSQAKMILKDYEMVMWDVLSKDYDAQISKEKCWKRLLNHTKNGSILVFHDSIKAKKNLEYVLPKVLAHYSKLGYRFDAF